MAIILTTGKPGQGMTLEKQKPCNASAWISISDFLDAQFLASFGLKRVARKGPACGKGPREAHPVGNTGGTSQIPKTGRGVLAPVLKVKKVYEKGDLLDGDKFASDWIRVELRGFNRG